jgi:uncharacterized membrane protein YhaH (DUF805 family)
MNWYLAALQKYVVFQGRARRKEYWFFALFNLLIMIGLTIIDAFTGNFDRQTGFGLLGLLYSLGVFLPSLAVSVRRLHDTGRTGWWLLISFIPLIGPLVLLVFLIFDSEQEDNEYGPNPKREDESEAYM